MFFMNLQSLFRYFPSMDLQRLILSSFSFYILCRRPTKELLLIPVHPFKTSCYSLSKLEIEDIPLSVNYCNSLKYKCFRDFNLEVISKMAKSVNFEQRVKFRYSICETVVDSHYIPSSVIYMHPSTS